jgi:alginate O-acetyltransferase complex protein AlgI
MIFNSVSYVLFLALFVLIFWKSREYIKPWLILIFSCIFYGFWKPEFLLLMFASSSVDYFLAKKIEDSNSQRLSKIYLLIGIVINLSFLIYFKYTIFIINSSVIMLTIFGVNVTSPELNIILPLAISFYTFEAISYLIDVYRGVFPAVRNYVHYACFITFFPKLIAGPVLRAAEIIPQFTIKNTFKINLILDGLEKIIFGLFLKVVLADNIAPIVDDIFLLDFSKMSGVDVLTAAFLFGFQIYFDFAGYSLIAIGSARLIGINIPDNFNFPYISYSPREFWKKWHISLSSWIRDYLYITIQGGAHRKKSSAEKSIDINEYKRTGVLPIISLFVTWAIMGLWHGANWTFVLWGFYHAVLIVIYRYSSMLRSKLSLPLRKYLGIVITLIIVMLGWIPFRAQSVGDAFTMWSRLFYVDSFFVLGLRENYYLFAAVITTLMFFIYFSREFIFMERHSASRFFVITKSLLLGFCITLVFVFFRPISQFIYFQF